MKFFSFAEIRAAGDCAAFARDVYGVKIANGRCAAAWRDGDNPESVSISKSEWYDHGAKRGGGIIELAAFRCGGDLQAAQEALGDYYRLTPKMETGPGPERESRYKRLLRDGYKEVAIYEYRDMDGYVRHITVRMEKED